MIASATTLHNGLALILIVYGDAPGYRWFASRRATTECEWTEVARGEHEDRREAERRAREAVS